MSFILGPFRSFANSMQISASSPVNRLPSILLPVPRAPPVLSNHVQPRIFTCAKGTLARRNTTQKGPPTPTVPSRQKVIPKNPSAQIQPSPSKAPLQPGMLKILARMEELNIKKNQPGKGDKDHAQAEQQESTPSIPKAPRAPAQQRITSQLPQHRNSSSNPEEDTTSFEEKKIINEKDALLQLYLLPVGFLVFGSALLYGTLALFDSQWGSLHGATGVEHTPTSDAWLPTFAMLKDGYNSILKETDNATIGIVFVSVAVQLLKRCPLPIWYKMIHIPLLKVPGSYTLFTHPLTHTTWLNLASTTFFVVWFLPEVANILGGDTFHASAFFFMFPPIMAYLEHFSPQRSIPGSVQAITSPSIAICAMFGAIVAARPHEKFWLPYLGVLRLEAVQWGLLWVAMESLGLIFVYARIGGALSRLGGAGLGAAYIYLDVDNNVWKPLVRICRGPEDPGKGRETSDVAV
ncbi:hypothetical protein K504DRAFT_455144 [Pleomassaria siparia CBS 279.74]|uniref:Peptidase S54 rhomboid domain-containing protein n=1 Tax=Pleomassaria siparia CBS 279.74 TaxID=1314801 RepID=A0A6G1K952_9PLEO|nr:hypothetical protein K504DRAFT_455144 [Pleomassaria siparia CBS 279.74]